MKDGSERPVVVLKSPENMYHIVINNKFSSCTQVISFDESKGVPQYWGLPNIDIFDSPRKAIDHIKLSYSSQFLMSGEALIGMTATKNSAVIIIADEFQVSGKLPGGHMIKTIKHASYLTLNHSGIDLGDPQSHYPKAKKPQSLEIKNPFKNTFKFSKSATEIHPPEKSKTNEIDVSQPTFMSSYEISEFPLADFHFYCETFDITRSYPSTHPVTDPDWSFVWNDKLSLPFRSLGLFVCVPILQGIANSASFFSSNFSLTYIARRSSIYAGTRYNARGLDENNNPANECLCDLIFNKKDHFRVYKWLRGSIPIRWHTTLTSKISAPIHEADEDFNVGTAEYFQNCFQKYQVNQIHNVSFLNTKPSGETNIKEHFEQALRGIQNVDYLSYNLNDIIKEKGPMITEMEFNNIIKTYYQNDGFTDGTYHGNAGSPPSFEFNQNQVALIRFNCADSLDRTNLGTFFYCLNLLRLYTGETSITKFQDAVDFLAQAFYQSGNIFSEIYTNSPAIKATKIGAFASQNVITNTPNEVTITLRRRYANVMTDPARNRMIMHWIHPPPFDWRTIIDPLSVWGHYLFTPDSHIISLNDCQIDAFFAKSVLLSGIRLYLPSCPFNESIQSVLLISGDVMEHVEIPQILEDGWYEFSFTPIHYTRHLILRMLPHGDHFVIGGIRFIGKVFNPHIRQLNKFDEITTGHVNYSDVSFNQTPIQIEMERINKNISIISLENQAIKNGINPSNIDPRSKFLPHICCICGQFLANENPNDHPEEEETINVIKENEVQKYCQCPEYPKLIIKEEKVGPRRKKKEGDVFPNNLAHDLEVCPKCIPIAEESCNLIEILRVKDGLQDHDENQLTTYPPSLISIPNCCFSYIENGIYTFVFYTTITVSHIICKKPNFNQVLLFGEEEVQKQNDRYIPPVQPKDTYILRFKIKPKNNPINVDDKDFEIHGAFGPRICTKFPVYSPKQTVWKKSYSMPSRWNPTSRILTLTFPKPMVITGVIMKSTSVPYRAIISNSSFDLQVPITIPQTIKAKSSDDPLVIDSTEKQLLYIIPQKPQMTTLDIFYIDPLPLKPDVLIIPK